MIIPGEWFVVFKKKSFLRWANWMPGRFKHCFCFAFVPELQCWVFVEFAALSGTSIGLVKNDEADPWLAEASREAAVVRIAARMGKGWGMGLYCVPLTAHTIGLSSCALLPDGLFRDCLAQGGELVIAGD